MNRSILSQNERDIFKLPLAIRLKQGLDGMAEVLFDNALKKQGKKLENPMFKRKKQLYRFTAGNDKANCFLIAFILQVETQLRVFQCYFNPKLWPKYLI